ncbi:hypothetical protein [Prauserella muralis]|uniref:Uncharacterized protein n=1 Tax=Prauserella muralis TaxID=588067 RepID=A0A2V4B2N3_9PSEU|nr:hypothetical protein [Prauserella muralis]PXY28252.1 hypothetical protein BAY60_18190 [Prauserella muralis]TWE27419.1 hypothetical protein FHX69_0042 [Prauserella muralis]
MTFIDVRRLLTTTGVLAALALLLTPQVAAADGDEGTDRAYDFVRQAIALIVNTPGDMEGIEDKVGDALEAPDASQVRMPLVERAEQALEGGDLHQVRALLERSLGARVHLGSDEPAPIGQPARPTGMDSGTVAALDPRPGRNGFNGGDWIILALSAAAGLGGVALSLRLRPRRLPHPGPGPVR